MRTGIFIALALGLAGIYVGLAAVLYSIQRSYLYFPNTQRPEIALAGVAGLQEIELATSDGLRLLAWYLPPQQNKLMVVYFHGNGGNLMDRVSWLVRFAKAGMGVLMPEYRGYAGNAGEPTETGLYTDADAAMEFLTAQGFGAERIVVFGESLGTGVATRVATKQRVAALILESPFTSVTAMAARQFYLLPVGLMLKDRFDSLSRIAQVDAPLLILHGERDEVVPAALGRELFAAASEPKEFWSAREGGHVNLLPFGAAEAVFDFLDRRVPSLQ